MSELENFFPTIPLRGVVAFPKVVFPLFVGRQCSVEAVKKSMKSFDKKLFLISQKNPLEEDPKADDLYKVGCMTNVLQFLTLPDNTIKILVEGVARQKIVELTKKNDVFFAKLGDSIADEKTIITLPNEENSITNEKEFFSKIQKTLVSHFENYVKLGKKIPHDIAENIAKIKSLPHICDAISAHIDFEIVQKQQLLEQFNISKRCRLLIDLLLKEINSLLMEKDIQRELSNRTKEHQRKYLEDERFKIIEGKLGIKEPKGEIDKLKDKIEKSKMSKEAKEKANEELKKLSLMSINSAEATISLNYIKCLLSLPWNKRSKLQTDLKKVKGVLVKNHYGLDEVKQRVLEYIAVLNRIGNKGKPTILCFVGAPGVGKTSLVKSIADAMDRKLVKMALGGLSDEAEIRGHRRTYIGAMPGRIIQNLIKAKVNNPVFLLDEIDKTSSDFKGNPVAALLEVLDPEQNKHFSDNFIDIDFDLSKVLFVATANSTVIHPALLDRMEIIHIYSYTESEKFHIAKNYILNNQIESNGLSEKEINISDDVIIKIVRNYTREAGVRSLDKCIAKICRKVVTKLDLTKSKKDNIIIDEDNIREYLGVEKYLNNSINENNVAGQVNGLAWTEYGGQILSIEAIITAGKGKTIYTGQLGEVMKESIQAAVTVVKNKLNLFNIDANFFEKNDIHIHVPEGATPKDGPSAGISMCVALVSAITKSQISAKIAMTGEITLLGSVLAIGGLKEKIIAAHRAGVKLVIIPKENEKELVDIPQDIKDDIIIKSVSNIEEVLEIVWSYEGSIPKFDIKKFIQTSEKKTATQ